MVKWAVKDKRLCFSTCFCFFVLMMIMMVVTIMAMVTLIRLLGHQCCGIDSNSFPMFSMKSRKLTSISLIFAKCGKAQFLKVKMKLESQSEAVTTFPKGEELSRWWWYKTDFLQAKFDHGDDTDFLKVNFHHGVQMFIPIITNLNVRAMREYLISLLSQLNWMSQKDFQLCEAADPDKLLGLRPNPHPCRRPVPPSDWKCSESPD